MARAAESGFDLSPANMARLLGFSIEDIMREPSRYGMTFVYVDTGNLFERSREIIEKIIDHLESVEGTFAPWTRVTLRNGDGTQDAEEIWGFLFSKEEDAIVARLLF